MREAYTLHLRQAAVISACILPCSVHASVSSAPVNYSCKLLITLTPGVRVWNDLGLQITTGATVISACILPCSVLASVMVYSSAPVNYICKLLITLTPGVRVWNDLGLQITAGATVISACILSCSVHASVSSAPVSYSFKLLINLTPGASVFNKLGLHITTEASCCDIYMQIAMQCPCFCHGLLCCTCKLQL